MSTLEGDIYHVELDKNLPNPPRHPNFLGLVGVEPSLWTGLFSLALWTGFWNLVVCDL